MGRCRGRTQLTCFGKGQPLTQVNWLMLAVVLVWPLSFTPACQALQPEEILVVANREIPESIELAEFYLQRRKVPEANLLRVSTTDRETCTREAYLRQIAEPVRKKLLAYPLARRPRCLLLVKGMPLRIAAVPLTVAEQAAIDGLRTTRAQLKGWLAQPLGDNEKQQLVEDLAVVDRRIQETKVKHDTVASVDSELMLVLASDYPLFAWVPNPFFLGAGDHTPAISKNDVVMVSRLDAPTAEGVLGLVTSAVDAEKEGLTGRAYFDARYGFPNDKPVSGYTLYDQSIHLAAARIRQKGQMPVTLDDTSALFQPGACPQAALYCGWYSLARYVDAFAWVPGAVGYHIASAECQTLRKGPSQVWCKRMLEEGVAVTIGPVGEPYVQAFPLPEIFFGMLVDGHLSVAECYLLSLPFLSWKMVLVGDPLYRPFR